MSGYRYYACGCEGYATDSEETNCAFAAVVAERDRLRAGLERLDFLLEEDAAHDLVRTLLAGKTVADWDAEWPGMRPLRAADFVSPHPQFAYRMTGVKPTK